MPADTAGTASTVAAPPARTTAPHATSRARRLADAVPRSDAAVAAAVALAVAGLGTTTGYRTFHAVADGSGIVPVPDGSAWGVLGALLAQNLAAALLLFSGVVTGGLSTLLGLTFTSIWVGATFRAVQAELGTGTVLERVLPYVGFELLGVGLAAVAGLLPAVAFVRSHLTDAPRRPFATTVHASVRLLALATALVVVGAAIETAVIVTARP